MLVTCTCGMEHVACMCVQFMCMYINVEQNTCKYIQCSADLHVHTLWIDVCVYA